MSLSFGLALIAKKVSASCWSAGEAAPKQKPVITSVGASAVSKRKPSCPPKLLDHPMHLPLKLPPDSAHQAFRDETPLFDTNPSWNALRWSLREMYYSSVPATARAARRLRKRQRCATLRKSPTLRTTHIGIFSTTVGEKCPKTQAEECTITDTTKANTTRRVSREGGTSSAFSAAT